MPRIAVGAAARVRFMSSGEVVPGTVAGISAGIAYTEDASTSLLQAPEPSFQWVRLAQRVPVEITLDARPEQVPLINGTTATVILEPAHPDERPLWRRFWDDFGWGTASGEAR